MNLFSRFSMAIVYLVLALAACSTRSDQLSEQQIVDLVWQALEPNTTSHDPSAWEVVSVHKVTGEEARGLFEGEPVPGSCAPGPTPPNNAMITSDRAYWYVQMKPRAATPQPVPSEQYSPTAPPHVPEPFVKQAHFLIDLQTNQVVARKLYCIIY